MTMPVVFARAAFAVVALFIAWITLTPHPDDARGGFVLARIIADAVFSDPALGDKVAHFSAYAGLGALALWGRLAPFGRHWAAPLTLAAYGAFLEGMQGLGGVRAMELADAVANALGAVSGYVGAYVVARLYAAFAS